ncbi:MAG: type II toxin-antitoxin system PemK/MazF family toxin [Coriobacteriales bacterium]|nr:type II toxin-antitoxin system PemK/MazF family toxin [Coriobacteriales bacterium]
MIVPSQGDIISINFDPTVGHEPQGKRPALVISADDFNQRSSLTVVAPITRTNNSYPLHVRIGSESDVEGFACLEQMRSLDLSSRSFTKLGNASNEELNKALEIATAIFGS